MRPGTCPAGSANRRGRGTATPSAGAGQAAGAGRPGGGPGAAEQARHGVGLGHRAHNPARAGTAGTDRTSIGPSGEIVMRSWNNSWEASWLPAPAGSAAPGGALAMVSRNAEHVDVF